MARKDASHSLNNPASGSASREVIFISDVQSKNLGMVIEPSILFAPGGGISGFKKNRLRKELLGRKSGRSRKLNSDNSRLSA